MGRKPNQEGRKEYLENPRTHFRFSDASDFREVFPNDAVGNETYLKPATGGKRLGKGSFRIVAHLPNKYHDDRENYLNKMKDGSMSRFMPSGSLPANRIRWDGASNAGAHLILHTKDGKRVEFYLVSLGDRNPRGAMVYATAVFPSQKTRKLVQCPVQVGFFGQSKSKPGEYKLTFQKPRIECGKNLAKAGHVPESFLKPDKKGKTVKAAEGGDFFMSEENHTYFHTVTGTQDVQIMNSETQATERAYYNPSDAMVGDETLDRYQITDSSTVDLTSNQPTANYGAESMGECFSCGEKAVSESLGLCLDCGQQYNAESMKDKSWKYLGDLHYSHNMGYRDALYSSSPVIFPQMASNLSKTEQDYFMRYAEKISNKNNTISKLNCDHCNPNGDNIQRQVVSIFMATKPTSMTVGRKGNSSISKFKKGDIISVGVSCANNVKDFKNAEGETATYSPSEEPDMVSSSSFEDPTNAHFSAECSCIPCGTCMAAEAFYAESSVEPANEPIAVAEGHSLDGYTPIDSLEEGAPIGHGVNQFFGSAESNEQIGGFKSGDSLVMIHLTGLNSTPVGVNEYGEELRRLDEGSQKELMNRIMKKAKQRRSKRGQEEAEQTIKIIKNNDFTFVADYGFSAEEHKNKWVKGKNGKTYVLRKKTGHMVTHNAESPGGAYPTLEGYSGVDSIAVEAPLGHGVTQWYAENADGPRPVFNEDITGQDGPSASPTNSNFSAQGMRRGRKNKNLNAAESAIIIGKNKKNDVDVIAYTTDAKDKTGFTPEKIYFSNVNHAVTGLSYLQNYSNHAETFSAQGMRRGRKNKNFNAIVSHRNKRGRFNGNQSVHSNSTGKFLRQGADTAGYLQDGALSLDGYTPLESVDVDRTSYQPTQNYGADQEIDMSFKDSVKVGAGLSVGVAAGSILLGVAGMLSLGLLGSFMGKGD